MNLMQKLFVVMLGICLNVSGATAQEKVYWDVVSKIREEGFQRSQVMDVVGYMTDVIGPRLTGSPNLKKGQQWAKNKMEEFGLVNTALDPWGEHGGLSWDNEYTSIHMLEPDYQSVIGYSLAFSPGTDGKITGVPVIVDILTAEDIVKYRGTLRNKIVMTSPPMQAGPRFTADAERFSEDELDQMAAAVIGNSEERTVTISIEQFNQLRENAGRSGPVPLSPYELTEFYKSEGVAVLLQAGRGGDGTVFLTMRPGTRGDKYLRSLEGAQNSSPMAAILPEHYNRMYRILQRGIPVTMEIEIRNRLEEVDNMEYNVIGEIRGSDLAGELVMVGGHYDSWHTGTGATDNAAGCAVAMEAMRILKAIGVQPRRTIRIALWSYEEGGHYGSIDYVANNFGSPKTGTKPDYDNFSGYFNMDNGTGQFRGVYLQGNEFVRHIFTEWMKPFHDLGMDRLTIDDTGGTDHQSFDEVGLPGFQFIQDRIDYNTRTHHSNMDVFDSLVPEDLMKNSVILASFLYHAAMRDDLLPREEIK